PPRRPLIPGRAGARDARRVARRLSGRGRLGSGDACARQGVGGRAHPSCASEEWDGGRTAGASLPKVVHRVVRRRQMDKSRVKSEYMQDFLNRVCGLDHDRGNPRTKQILRRLLGDLYQAIEDLDVTDDEYWTAKIGRAHV